MKDVLKTPISPGIEFHSIRSEKFKTAVLSLYINVPLSAKDATKNALLPSVLKRGSVKYDNFTKLYTYMEELFGAELNIDVRKKGDSQVLYFSLEYVDDKYIPEGISKKIVDLLYQIVFCPLLEGGGFKPEYVDTEKENLRRTILGLINDKREYAHAKCIEKMFNDEPYGIFEYGRTEDLDEINPKNLYEHYMDIISRSHIDIIYSGSADGNIIKSYVNEIFTVENLNRHEGYILPSIKPARNNVNTLNEEMDVNQSKLCMGLRTGIAPNSDDYIPLIVCNSILGGGAFSKLFNNVREKLSLCYYVFSRLDKFKGVMTIDSGIEKDKYDQAYNEILKQIDCMKAGDFDENEIMAAKMFTTNNLNMLRDSQLSMEDFYISSLMTDTPFDLDKLILKVNSVTKEEIIHAAQNLKLDTVYLLSSKNSVEVAVV